MHGAQLGGRSIKVGRPNGRGAPVQNKGAMSNPLMILQQQQQQQHLATVTPMLAALKAQASEGERVGRHGGTLSSVSIACDLCQPYIVSNTSTRMPCTRTLA